MNRNNPFFAAFGAVVLFLLGINSLPAETSEGISPDNGGLLFTFDDGHNIANWVRQIPLFQKYGVKATFFINAPNEIDAEGWENLRRLKAIGCAVEFHGMHHWKPVDKMKELGWDEYYAQEIKAGLDILEAHGFPSTTFGHPYTQWNEEVNQRLIPYFNHFRIAGWLMNGQTFAQNDQFFVPYANLPYHAFLTAFGTDGADEKYLTEMIFPALERAKVRKEFLVFASHNIAEEKTGFFIRPAILEKIFQKGAELGLPFYSFDQLPPYRGAETGDQSGKNGRLAIYPQIIADEGSDGKTCWVHARAASMPGGKMVMTAQRLLLTGSDVFYAIHSAQSDKEGELWPPLQEQKVLGRFPLSDGLEAVPCDGFPAYHAASGKVLLTGHLAFYENNAITDKRVSLPLAIPEGWAETRIWFSVYDEENQTWSAPDFLTVPQGSEAVGGGAGCSQRCDLPDGTILLPIYVNKASGKEIPGGSQVVVLHCSFDGKKLRYLEEGAPLRLAVPRGFGEPSLVRFQDRFYLTLRNDEKGYAAVSDDGLNFSEPIPWRWDDNGEEIGNYNTQQHWLTIQDRLYLVYTRRAGNNDHVFRHRAPLFIAEVNPQTLALQRETEQIAVPERGARLGNFGVTQISADEGAVIVSEWMQSLRGGGSVGYNDCQSHGATGAIWISKIRTPR